jgi:hypothetical protein
MSMILPTRGPRHNSQNLRDRRAVDAAVNVE